MQAGDKVVAIVKRSAQTGNQMYYLHDDHLGSTDVITNAAGAVIRRLDPDIPRHRALPYYGNAV